MCTDGFEILEHDLGYNVNQFTILVLVYLTGKEENCDGGGAAGQRRVPFVLSVVVI